MFLSTLVDVFTLLKCNINIKPDRPCVLSLCVVLYFLLSQLFFLCFIVCVAKVLAFEYDTFILYMYLICRRRIKLVSRECATDY